MIYAWWAIIIAIFMFTGFYKQQDYLMHVQPFPVVVHSVPTMSFIGLRKEASCSEYKFT